MLGISLVNGRMIRETVEICQAIKKWIRFPIILGAGTFRFCRRRRRKRPTSTSWSALREKRACSPWPIVPAGLTRHSTMFKASD